MWVKICLKDAVQHLKVPILLFLSKFVLSWLSIHFLYIRIRAYSSFRFFPTLPIKIRICSICSYALFNVRFHNCCCAAICSRSLNNSKKNKLTGACTLSDGSDTGSAICWGGDGALGQQWKKQLKSNFHAVCYFCLSPDRRCATLNKADLCKTR